MIDPVASAIIQEKAERRLGALMIDAERRAVAHKEIRRPKILRGWVLLGLAVAGWIIVGLAGYIIFLSGVGWREILSRMVF